jgi:hypothetical protein
LPAPESGNNRPPSADAGRPDSGHGQKSTESGQNGRDPAGFRWIWSLIQPDLAGIKYIGNVQYQENHVNIRHLRCTILPIDHQLFLER